MQQRLALLAAALQVAAAAVLFYLGDVATNRPPAFDLPLVVRAAAAHVVAAVPLEPAARVFFVEPTLFAPHGERLRGVDAEVVQLGVVPLVAQLGAREPIGRVTSRSAFQ